MNNVSAALPRKSLSPVEREFLKQGNRMLLNQSNGRVAAAALMDTAGSSPAKAGFARIHCAFAASRQVSLCRPTSSTTSSQTAAT